MNNEWISRNPSDTSRKRDRSYDDNWGTYEARGSGSGRQAWRGSFGGGGDGTSHRQHPLPHSSSSFQSHDRPQSSSSNNMGGAMMRNGVMTEGERVGVSHGNSNASRLRIPDHRGVAARVGALPPDCPPSTSFQTNSSNTAGGFNLFQNSAFMKTISNPPPITSNLPNDLRSTLNDEQCHVVESILSGHSTFFTGPAGSGKSHVLKTLLKANTLGVGGRNGRPRKVVVTATTGVAACNVGGITIHSFAGVGSGSASAADMARRVMGNEYAKQRWKEVDVLVIDEVSMMASSFLDKLSFIASRARNDRRPFGGVQLVVCGDFFQLPPVELKKDGFAFEAKCWSEVIQCSVLLRQVFRQQGDTTLMDILDEARIGELSVQSAEVLRRHSTLPAAAFNRGTVGDETQKIIPTLLECRNKEVDKANEREMAKLPGEIHSFHSRDRAMSDAHKAQLKHCQAPQQLDLKVGAQVILLKNIDLERGLANGSRGVVVRFQPPKSEGDVPTGFKKMDLPVVRFGSVKPVGKVGDGDDDDDAEEFTIHPEEWQNKMGEQTVSSRIQIPLRLAWSISVHKSQGMTIPNLTVNLAGVFEYGQAYVALSRATELKLLTLRGFSAKAFRAHPKVKEFYRMLDQGCSYSPTEPNNKENKVAQQFEITSDLCDPFEDQTPSNPYATGSSNPYLRPKCSRSPMRTNNNPYKQARPAIHTSFQHHRPAPFHQQSHANQNTTATSNAQFSKFGSAPQNNKSPPLTHDQLQRMEENRQRALAIRMKKQRIP